MPRLLAGALLASAWIAFGVFALLPTAVLAIVAAQGQRHSAARLPFGWFLVFPLVAGVLLGIAYGTQVLPSLQVWLQYLAELRPLKTTLAVELLGGKQDAEDIYLKILIGEITIAACILFLASRPGMWARSIQYICDDFAQNTNLKISLMGLFFIVLAALLCWGLLTTGVESRRIEIYSIFFPIAPFGTCIFAAIGWQMLFSDHLHAPPRLEN